MKRIVILGTPFFLFCTFIGYAQSGMLEKGFSVKFSFGFPPSQYGFDGELPLPEELEINTTFGLEIGNQWYFLKREHFGLGLDINWFDVVYGRAKMDEPLLGEVNRLTLEGSFLEFGPVATYAINDLIAFEGYYNLRPTYMATYYYENPDDFVLLRNFNFLHGLGIGVRLKFVYVGYEYTFGSVDGKVEGGGELEDVADLFDSQPMDDANSKLVVGFQF
jgi:hypothetical protein